MRHPAIQQAARATMQAHFQTPELEQREAQQAAAIHTAWKWIPKSWQDALLKKKAKPKAGYGGEDEVVTIHMQHGEVSVGRGIFKTKVIKPPKGEIGKFVRTLKSSQRW